MPLPEQPDPAWAHQVRSRVTRGAAVALVEEPVVATVLALTVGAYKVVDRDVADITADREQAADLNPEIQRIACKEGCSFCCHYRVSVVPVEAITVAQFMKDHWSPEQIEVLRERTREYGRRLDNLSPEERLSRPIPCMFLQEGKCSIYEVRPIACRMHHSLDAEACERGLEDPDAMVPIPPDYRHATRPVLQGLLKGPKMALKRSYDLEFARAIQVLLDDPEAATKWLAGEDTFAVAEDAEVRALLKAKSKGEAEV